MVSKKFRRLVVGWVPKAALFEALVDMDFVMIWLEAISKLPQCNEDASNVKESWVHLNLSFPTNN